MSYILLIGALERDNFGDLLFGQLLERFFFPIPCISAGLLGRDMRPLGGATVVGLADAGPFLERHPPLGVVHCGGQTLPVGTPAAVAMDLLPVPGIGPNPESEDLASLISGRASPVAYINGSDELFPGAAATCPIAFISIGGTSGWDFARRNPRIIPALRGAAFVAVRDPAAHAFVAAQDVAAELAPDIVHTLAAHYPLRLLKDIGQGPNDRTVPYLVFQANGRYVDEWLDGIATQVVRCAREQECRVILQPSGLAGRHDTIESLKRLRRAVQERDVGVDVYIADDRHVWRQVSTIANCVCWAGTSLHGWITATTYGRPATVFGSPKSLLYVRHWAPGSAQPSDGGPSAISDTVRQAVSESPMLRAVRAESLASAAQASIDNMRSALRLPSSVLSASLPFDPTSVLSAELERLRAEVVRLHVCKQGQHVTGARGPLS